MKKDLNSKLEGVKIMSVPVSKSLYEKVRKAAFLKKLTIAAYARQILIEKTSKKGSSQSE